MKKVLFFCSLILFINCLSFATIHRVGYPGTGIVGIDYSTVQEAHDAAVAGDTIQFYFANGGQNLVLTKKVFIIGFGYNLDNNTGNQIINTQNTGIIYPTFNSGSEHSVLEGLTLERTFINASNITIKKSSLAIGITFNTAAPIDSTQFIACTIYNGVQPNYNYPVSGGNQDHTNILFANCYISNSLTGITFINFSENTTGRFLNCISDIATTTYNFLQISNSRFLVKNCIFKLASFNSGPTSNTIYENNFFINGEPVPALNGSNNRFNQDYAAIITGIGGDYSNCATTYQPCFTESFYLLKSGSVALNGGFDDAGQPTDCGIFGGEASYKFKLGGIPSVPSIYLLAAPSGSAASSNPYNVNISVKSNN